MNLSRYLDFRLLGLVGSVLLIISEFLTWFSELTLINIYLFTTAVALGDSFLYLFPLVCGIICLSGTLLVLYKKEYRINSVIINFIGLGFFLVFIFNLIPRQLIYIPFAKIGFYFSIIGAILVFFDILNILMT